jgi:uncharacterized small protein (DUF1192 family)
MNSSTHPVEKEELMAYFDGELPVERAAAVAAHLELCAGCRALGADLRALSERLGAWQVERSPARLSERVTAVLAEPARKPKIGDDKQGLLGSLVPRRPLIPRWGGGVVGAFVLLLVGVAVSIPNLLRSRIATNPASRPVNEMQDGTRGTVGSVQGEAPYAPQQPAGPMIVRTASLALVSKEFDPTRTAIETLVRQHQGYCAQLTVSGQAGAGRTLTATFRVPANQLDAVLAKMKNLGRVEQESQEGEEVTQQYVDLGARLSNARHTEQRLIEVLRQRAGKVGDVLAVEQQIARVREEIERLEAQLKNLDKQVRFASLQVRLTKEYKAQLEVTPPSTTTRLRNSTVEGYRSLIESALGLVMFLLSYGPVLLFWGLVLYGPTRFAWRRLRA